MRFDQTAAVALALLACGVGRAELVSGPVVFSAELYPQLAGQSAEEVRLAGVAALCPGRLLRAAPGSPAPVVPELRKTRTAELPRGGAYLRLYSLDAATVRAYQGRSAMVVDCRYLVTSSRDVAGVAALAEALTGGAGAPCAVRGDYPPMAAAAATPEMAAAAGRFPVLVLVNGRTAGPLEAALAALQHSGAVTLVGSKTAGETGVFAPLAGHSGWWALTGEILPAGGSSLVGLGVAPKFPVKVSPEEEFPAWQVIERGAALAQVLPREAVGKTESGKATAAESGGNGAGKTLAEKGAELVDPVLSRAQDVLVALRVLGGA